LPLFDDEAEAFLAEVDQRADAFLFGRRTYESFAGYWGGRADSGPIAVALNTRPKYVASTTLTDPRWADTTVLSGDVAAAVGELNAKPGGELQVHGSGRPGPLARRQPPGRRDHPAHLSRGRRPGHAAIPRRGDDSGLPAHRAPAVRNGHGRLKR
jgi:hypothetical protein